MFFACIERSSYGKIMLLCEMFASYSDFSLDTMRFVAFLCLTAIGSSHADYTGNDNI